MRPSSALLLLLALAPSCAVTPATADYSPSPDDRAAVLRLVNEAFAAIAAGSQADWEAILTEEGSFAWVAGEQGNRSIGHLSYAEHLERQQTPSQRYHERIWDPGILVDGDLAVVWAPYDFHIDGSFSHAGVDAINLVRRDDGWRIAAIVWSVETVQRADAPQIEFAAAPSGAPTEVFLVLAQSGQPAELRLRDAEAPRYPLSSREEVAQVIRARGSKTVRLRHGSSVPQAELNDLVAFLQGLGVESIEYVLAPPPPTNPAPRA